MCPSFILLFRKHENMIYANLTYLLKRYFSAYNSKDIAVVVSSLRIDRILATGLDLGRRYTYLNIHTPSRSSHPSCSIKKGFLKNFTKLIGKHQC